MRYQLCIDSPDGPVWTKLARTLPAEKKGDAWVYVVGGEVDFPIVRILGKLGVRTDTDFFPIVEEAPCNTKDWNTGQIVAGKYVIATKVLEDGSLQYIRRTGRPGIAPPSMKWTEGEPKVGQWREHPADIAVSTSFSSAKAAKRGLPGLPEGAELA